MKTFLEEFGERVCNARMMKGLTQQELAEKLNFKSRSSINKIERGKQDLPRNKVIELANALGVTPDYLMGWKAERTIQDKFALLNEANQKTVLNLVDFLLANQEAKQ